MRAIEHWEKAARLEASRSKGLDERDDYELIIWSCIQGGGQLANVILHSRGITEDNQDQIHSDLPELKQQLPHDIREFLSALKSIERLGSRFVRGIEPIRPGIVKDCLDEYSKLKVVAGKLLQARVEPGARKA